MVDAMGLVSDYSDCYAQEKRPRRGHRKKKPVQNKDKVVIGDDDDDLFEMQLNPADEGNQDQQIVAKIY